MAPMAQQQQLPLERLRQVPQDLTQQLQTVAAAPLQHWISAFLGELQAPLEQLALRVQLALTAQTVLTEPLQPFLLGQSLQAQLVRAQLLPTAAAVLLQRLTFLFLEAQQVQQAPLVLKGLLVRTAPMVRMEVQTLF